MPYMPSDDQPSISYNSQCWIFTLVNIFHYTELLPYCEPAGQIRDMNSILIKLWHCFTVLSGEINSNYMQAISQKTGKSQHKGVLFGEMPWGFIQTFRVSRGWILTTLLIPWRGPHVWLYHTHTYSVSPYKKYCLQPISTRSWEA